MICLYVCRSLRRKIGHYFQNRDSLNANLQPTGDQPEIEMSIHECLKIENFGDLIVWGLNSLEIENFVDQAVCRSSNLEIENFGDRSIWRLRIL